MDRNRWLFAGPTRTRAEQRKMERKLQVACSSRSVGEIAADAPGSILIGGRCRYLNVANSLCM